MAATYNISKPHKDFVERNPIRPGRHTVAARAALERRTVHIEDVHADPEYTYGVRDYAPHGSLLGVPMLRGDELLGVIVLIRGEVRPFTDKQIELVTTFADQAVIAIENVRLFDAEQQRTRELTEALEQQTATSEVLQVISSSPGELDPVFQAMLANATKLCEASYGLMYLCEGDALRMAALHGDLPAAFKEQWRSGTLFRPHPDVAPARAILTRKVIHVTDLREDPAYLSGDPLPVDGVEVAGMRTLVVIPMLKENEPVGVISIYRTEVRPFTDKQIDVVKSFANQAVIAIENTRLLNELRESLQQQTATADVLKVISRSTFDLQAVFDTLVESAARLCRANQANLARVIGDRLQYVAAYGFPPGYLEHMQRVPRLVERGSASGRAVLEGGIVHIEDVLADSEFTLLDAQKLGQFRTVLAVPLLREGTAIGALFLTRPEVEPFTQNQIDLITTFADQAVIAIENARLFEEVQARTRALSESLEQQTATSEVLRVISSSPGELEPVFEAMLANATRLCEAGFGVLFRSEADALRAVALHDAPPLFAEERRRNPVIRPSPDSTLGRAVATKQTVQIADVQDEPTHVDSPSGTTGAQLAKLAGARAVVAVPMLKENELIGTIVIYRQEVRPFTEKQIELVENFA